MFHSWQKHFFSSFVTFQSLCHHHPRRESLLSEQLFQEFFGRCFVSTLLIRISSTFPSSSKARHNQNTSPLVWTRISSKCHLRPGLGRRRRSSLANIYANIAIPVADGFVGDENAPVEHYLFHISTAEGKSEIEPNAMADDFGGETVTAVQVRLSAHGRIIPDFAFSQQPSFN